MQQLHTYRVYLAGASIPEEIDRVGVWSNRLTKAGIAVVSTWPGVVAAAGAGNPRDASKEQRRQWSGNDLYEVGTADALWLLCPPPGTTTRGAWVELGFAYARSMMIISSGDTHQSIFTALGIECERDEDAFAGILQVAGRAVAP